MTTVTELDLPAFDYTAPDFAADRYHQQLADARASGWLAQSPLAVLVLDREAGEFFLRSRATAFPGGRSQTSSGSLPARCATTSTPTSSTSPASSTAGCGRWSARRSRREPRTGGGR